MQSQFAEQLKKISSSQTTLNGLASFALSNSQHAADLWDSLLEECAICSGHLNRVLNYIFFIDTLLSSPPSLALKTYRGLVERDLESIVHFIVFAKPESALNARAVLDVLQLWAERKWISPDLLDRVAAPVRTAHDQALAQRIDHKGRLNNARAGNLSIPGSSQETLQRFEDDRERWKRLRERAAMRQIPSTWTPHILQPFELSSTFYPHAQTALYLHSANFHAYPAPSTRTQDALDPPVLPDVALLEGYDRLASTVTDDFSEQDILDMGLSREKAPWLLSLED